MTDRLSPRLREIEAEIDSIPLRNPILALPRNRAVAHVLDYVTRLSLNVVPGESRWDEIAPLWDSVAPGLQEVLVWILEDHPNATRPGDLPWPLRRDPLLEFETRRLLNAGISYSTVRRFFIHASAGNYAIRLDGNQIIREATAELRNDHRYSVYQHLAHSKRMSRGGDAAVRLNKQVSASVKAANSGGYELRRERRLYSIAFAIFQQRQEAVSTLPRNWAFAHYTFNELLRVGATLSAVGAVHHAALIVANRRRYVAPEWAFLRRTRSELVRTVGQIAGVDELVASTILSDLTLGGRGLKRPDISLQPLVPLGGDNIGIIPFQIINLWWERNLLSLLNKFPTEQAIYSVLKNEKADRMRSAVEKVLTGATTPFHGRVSPRKEMPDVDVALLDRHAKLCLVLELKWFIAPGEPREDINRSKELSKAFRQLRTLRDLIQTDSKARVRMGIDQSWEVRYAVVSAQWIGHEFDQHPDFPIVRLDHLQSQLRKLPDLRAICDWISSRSYLPVDGEHFVNSPLRRTRIGGWTMVEPSFKILDKSIEFEHTPYD